jgi:DNA-directed RNA polymerase subunit RPC12/RpoP
MKYDFERMSLHDPEQERLARVYAAMTDSQLDQLDDQAHTLTSAAREALEAELGRRELHFSRSPAAPAHDELELQDLRTVRQFRDLPEALLAKGLLESAGIPCFLADDNIVRMDWFISNFVGGIKLQVRPEDEAAAVAVLDQPIPEKFDFQGEESYEQPRCPKCSSLDIAYENINKPIAYTSAYLGVPIALKQNSWKCGTCGREWEEIDH